MTTIENTKQLPRDLLRCLIVTNAEAKEIATQYQASWFYPLRGTDKGYLYILNSEYKEKRQS